ncbi:hypothetical protein RHGRI_034537 [Rhododendron griersonianum]|uniref:ATP-dependent DNA helicase n=1 Tax=Rhododendron griersonianum TaxID=479676 RepID=A0AAV6I103_9ERIC|nr:hypothetical protein RHGRI_034537 [Rhododendron griersonianum]
MTRCQFSIRLPYAMTINKSQGQSVKFVGVDLHTTMFSHAWAIICGIIKVHSIII